MKITLNDKDVDPNDTRYDGARLVTKDEFIQHMIRTKEIKMPPQVVKFAAEQLGMTPDEFIAFIMKEAGSAH
jgi:hypothetical protein